MDFLDFNLSFYFAIPNKCLSICQVGSSPKTAARFARPPDWIEYCSLKFSDTFGFTGFSLLVAEGRRKHLSSRLLPTVWTIIPACIGTQALISYS
jgi:hypothetical protein